MTDTSVQTGADFEQLRPYLLRVAYSHLGSLGEAEDAVQEAWIRLTRVDRSEIRDLRAWLTTVVSRLALDALTSARARREHYVGPWLPEPVVDDQAPDPARRVDLDEEVSMALLIVLESLSPAERSAFLLHDVFGYSFEEVARVVDRTPAATRQLASRARQAVEARRPRCPADADQQREVVDAFRAATEQGDIQSLLALLDPDVVMRSDGGGIVPAAHEVLLGAERVASLLTRLANHFRGTFRTSPITVNGAPGILFEAGDQPTIISLTIDDGRIVSVDAVRNPEKLQHWRRSVRGAEQ